MTAPSSSFARSGEVRESRAVGSALTAHLAEALGKNADAVYWEFPERD